ncbi:MAG: hypothetical protein H6707_06255 [Deltaproteobacteria bacterium]|nr:hypothetical protein [Deltaproteobacteria bacterium]
MSDLIHQPFLSIDAPALLLGSGRLARHIALELPELMRLDHRKKKQPQLVAELERPCIAPNSLAGLVWVNPPRQLDAALAQFRRWRPALKGGASLLVVQKERRLGGPRLEALAVCLLNCALLEIRSASFGNLALIWGTTPA